jgi:C1A family cysteine protease
MNLISNFLLFFIMNILFLQELKFISSDEIKADPNKNQKKIKKSKRRKIINTNKFKKFKTKFNKIYNKLDELYKINIFEINLKEIDELNKKAKGNRSKQSVFFDVNVFSDIPKEKFFQKHLGFNFNDLSKNSNFKEIEKKIKPLSLISKNTSKLKNKMQVDFEYDLRKTGLINKPTDQGNCGCCWAFSSIYAIEGQASVKYGKKITLFPQELLDCALNTYGCNGGDPCRAFYYTYYNGLSIKNVYPYTEAKDTCKYDFFFKKENDYGRIYLSDYWYHMNLSGYESYMKDLLLQLKSYVIAINANQMKNYVNGIIDFDSLDCDPENVNHAVTLVGYKIENGVAYWIVKNSWGSDWGEGGYFRVAFGKNVCGVAKYAFCPKV